ncbi:hypothetical protein FOZ62_007908, partial [Perkinsus olseni]
MILDWERGDITGNAADFVTARWTGFIQAEFSEEYTFYVDADDHARLWIDDVLLFDKWDICCGGFWGRAVLSAGVYHYIKLEYRELTGQAHLKLYWSSFSQVKEPIPASRMYRAPAISGMPLSIDVTVGNLLPQNCLAYGHQLTQSSAGLPSVFYIQAKDTEGNNMTDSNGAVFVVQLATSGSTVSVVSAPLNESIGLYAVHYLLTKAGTYTVTIKSSNVDISNSGASLDVSPGPPAASTTVVTDGLAGAIDFMAGVPKVLRVTVKDVYGNVVERSQEGSFNLSLNLEWRNYSLTSSLALLDDSTQLTADFGRYFELTLPAQPTEISGIYDLTFTGLRAGNNRLYIRLNGEHILGSPFDIVGEANSASPFGPASVLQSVDPP